MKNSKWLILLSVVALVGLTACSSDDDPIIPEIPDLPTAAVAQGAIEGAIDEVVDPVLWASEFLKDQFGLKAGMARGVSMICPFEGERTCNVGGSVACSESTAPIGLAFDFMSCAASIDTESVTIDGTAIAEWDGSTTYTFTLQSGLTLNGTGITGTMTISPLCSMTDLNIASNGTTALGRLEDCDGGGEWPDSTSHLTITTDIGFLLEIIMTFDNTSTADADVYVNDAQAFDCTVDLDETVATCVEV